MSEVLTTQFATPERSDPAALSSQVDDVAQALQSEQLLDCINELILIVNEHRQIVYVNQRLLDSLGVTLEDVLGERPGELLGCIHAHETPQGCGTTAHCSECGAVAAILSALERKRSERECRILLEDSQAMDLRLLASPLVVEGRVFAVCALQDISDVKRRETLERTFLHDLLNTAGSIVGATHMLKSGMGGDPSRLVEIIGQGTTQLLDEIQFHRTLSAAEEDSLAVSVVSVAPLSLLGELVELYQSRPLADGLRLRIDPSSDGIDMQTDRTLLNRVLGNLVKNALEATMEGEAVTLACRRDAEDVVFTVHNPGTMDDTVRLQVFQRSFSTKGAGRGIGTFSVKLLTERYLGGSVGFSSVEPEGTEFWVRIPVRGEVAQV